MIVGTRTTHERGPFTRKGQALVIMTVQELHSTKGWRTVQRRKGVTTSRETPERKQFWVPTHRPGPVPTAYAPPEIPLKALMRHRERRRDIQRAANLARLQAD